MNVERVYVVHNPKIFMDGFEEELVQQIKDLGIEVAVVYLKDDVPPNEIALLYTAHWEWDMAMYLQFFQVRVFKNDVIIGTVNYDCRRGGANMGKFGRSAEKIRPLLHQLFLR